MGVPGVHEDASATAVIDGEQSLRDGLGDILVASVDESVVSAETVLVINES